LIKTIVTFTTKNYLPNRAAVKQLANCQFTSEYFDSEKKQNVEFKCNEQALDLGLYCRFHDRNYLQNSLSEVYKQHDKNVMDELMIKVNDSIANNKALLCIGYHLPDITIKENFTQPVYFIQCNFQGRADFSSAKFSGEADFSCKFNRETHFNYVLFEDGKKILFESEDLSKVLLQTRI
jgi:hypothetical protein